jgi:hypothetical protein
MSTVIYYHLLNKTAKKAFLTGKIMDKNRIKTPKGTKNA